VAKSEVSVRQAPRYLKDIKPQHDLRRDKFLPACYFWLLSGNNGDFEPIPVMSSFTMTSGSEFERIGGIQTTACGAASHR
jgi:hypothetical protein